MSTPLSLQPAESEDTAMLTIVLFIQGLLSSCPYYSRKGMQPGIFHSSTCRKKALSLSYEKSWMRRPGYKTRVHV